MKSSIGILTIVQVIALAQVRATAQSLFVSDASRGNIYELTPAGTRSIFASSLAPVGVAFDRTGNLYEADYGSGHIYEYTPGGTRSIFASGLNFPVGLAFDGAGNLFVSDVGNPNGAGFGTDRKSTRLN